MINNKRGQTIFTTIFYIIIFVLLIGGGLGYFVITLSGIALDSSGISGVEAFFIANLILWIILAFILAVMWWTR